MSDKPLVPDKYKSRKLWFFIALGFLFTRMQWVGVLPVDGVVYSTLMMWVIIGFTGGNVGEHMSNRGQ